MAFVKEKYETLTSLSS